MDWKMEKSNRKHGGNRSSKCRHGDKRVGLLEQ